MVMEGTCLAHWNRTLLSTQMRQISQRGAILQNYSQFRAVWKVFPRGCCFCTSPAWDAPFLMATSCMADTCRGGRKAPLLLAIWDVGNASTVGATVKAPLLLAIQPRGLHRSFPKRFAACDVQRVQQGVARLNGDLVGPNRQPQQRLHCKMVLKSPPPS